jgi:hypothetical protein
MNERVVAYESPATWDIMNRVRFPLPPDTITVNND